MRFIELFIDAILCVMAFTFGASTYRIEVISVKGTDHFEVWNNTYSFTDAGELATVAFNNIQKARMSSGNVTALFQR